MKASAGGWRKWTTALLGAYLFAGPWVFGTSGHAASSANAWIAGVCVVVAALRVPTVSGPRTAELIKAGSGAWLLASPFVLGFGGSAAAWNAWITGVLILALTDIRSLALDFSSWLHAQKLRYQAHRLSPEKLLRYGKPGRSIDPEQLSRHIAERSYQIRRTLQEDPSDLEVKMCALGYRVCASDTVVLAGLIDEELPRSGPIRRLRFKIARHRATRSLSCAREALPPDARHARQ
jgi:hypothetical protein